MLQNSTQLQKHIERQFEKKDHANGARKYKKSENDTVLEEETKK